MKIDKWVVNKGIVFFSLSFCILVLPGCDWLKRLFSPQQSSSQKPSINLSDMPSKESRIFDPQDPVLVYVNDQPAITMSDLENEFESLVRDNPQIKEALPLMPNIRENLLDGLAKQKIVDIYIKDKGIDQQEDYKKELERISLSVTKMLNTTYLRNQIDVTVTDREVRQFYDDNKTTMPDLLISQGGIQTKGLLFGTETEATDFLNKAKATSFDKAAEQANLIGKVQNFNLINKQSLGIDAGLKKTILNIKSFPALEIHKVDDTSFWIIFASSQKDPEYRPFEQIEAGLKQYLDREKKMNEFNKKIEQLKKEYNVVIKQELLKSSTPENENPDLANEMEQEEIALQPAPSNTAL